MRSAPAGAQQLHDPEVVGEKGADQAHRAQVVDDRQGEQEDPQVRRAAWPATARAAMAKAMSVATGTGQP